MKLKSSPRLSQDSPHKPAAKKAMQPRKATAGAGNPERETSRPIRSGLVVVLVEGAALMLHARAAIERRLSNPTVAAGWPLPQATMVHSLYIANSCEAAVAEQLAQSDGRSPKSWQVQQIENNGGAIAWTKASANLMLSQLSGGKCVTKQQTVTGAAGRESIVHTIRYLDTGAKAKAGLVVLFLHCVRKEDFVWLQHCSTKLLVVKECMPGPDASIAFSIQAVALDNQRCSEFSAWMCQINMTGNRCSRQWSPLIAERQEDRTMFHMRSKGASLEEIGQLMGLNRSTVMRRLNRIESSLGINVKRGWSQSRPAKNPKTSSSKVPKKTGSRVL